MNIPNLVYKSLDVGTPYFSTITNVVIEMTLGIGASCNTLTVEQIGRICGVGVNRANCDTSEAPKLAYDISIVIKYILTDW